MTGLPFIMLIWFSFNSGIKYGLFKFWIFLLVSVTLYFVIQQLFGAKKAIYCFCTFVAVQACLNFFPANEKFKIEMIGWRSIDEISEIKTQIPTHRNSPKWRDIRKHSDARPYLYFSMSTPNPGNNIQISINGERFDFSKNYGALLKSTSVGGFAFPLEWSTIDNFDFLDVHFTLNDAEGMTFFTGFYPSDKYVAGKQETCTPNDCTSTEKKMDGTRFVIEIRVADDINRVLGILY